MSATSANNVKNSKNKIARSSRSRNSYSFTSQDADFDFYFRKLCNQEKIEDVLSIYLTQEEKPTGSASSVTGKTTTARSSQKNSAHNFIAVYENAESKTNLYKLIIKNTKMHLGLLNVLGSALKQFTTITILKFESCNLNLEELKLLKTILEQSTSITELNITDNPIEYQVFHRLLKKTRLQYVTFKLCRISDKGVEKLAKILSDFEHPLVYLNLSSNRISSEGCKHLSKMLRVNRNLKGLCLTDNWITDEGCTQIMNSLKKFPLSQDEITLRRRRIFSYLLKRKELIRKDLATSVSLLSLDNTTISSRSKRSKSSTSRKRKSSKERSQSISSPRRRNNSASNVKKNLVPIPEKDIYTEVDKILGKDLHPFVSESLPINLEIVCSGNLSLSHLNLSYNKISKEGAQDIINTLIYQDTLIKSKKEGLTCIMLNGYPECKEKLEEIGEIIYHKLSKSYPSFKNKSGSIKNIKKNKSNNSRKSV